MVTIGVYGNVVIKNYDIKIKSVGVRDVNPKLLYFFHSYFIT
jgi:hypothetical protein